MRCLPCSTNNRETNVESHAKQTPRIRARFNQKLTRRKLFSCTCEEHICCKYLDIKRCKYIARQRSGRRGQRLRYSLLSPSPATRYDTKSKDTPPLSIGVGQTSGIPGFETNNQITCSLPYSDRQVVHLKIETAESY